MMFRKDALRFPSVVICKRSGYQLGKVGRGQPDDAGAILQGNPRLSATAVLINIAGHELRPEGRLIGFRKEPLAGIDATAGPNLFPFRIKTRKTVLHQGEPALVEDAPALPLKLKRTRDDLRQHDAEGHDSSAVAAGRDLCGFQVHRNPVNTLT